MSDEAQTAVALIVAARKARENAYAPYSGFAVGAALQLNDGEIVSGANFENASYGLSLCAETVAIASANAAGRLRDIVAIAIIGGAMEAHSLVDSASITPCGRCRQILAEAARLAGRDIRVYCADASGEWRNAYWASELLPHAFSATAFAHGHSK